jgi:hypothetical protein
MPALWILISDNTADPRTLSFLIYCVLVQQQVLYRL